MLLDSCSNFNDHVQSKISKWYKLIGVIICTPTYLMFTRHLLDTAISFLINLIKNHSIVELKVFNEKLV